MKPRSYFYLYFSIIFVFVVFSFSCSLLNAQAWLQPVNVNVPRTFFDVQKSFNEYWKDKKPQKGKGWKQFKRWENFWEPRLYPTGEFPNGMKIYNEWQEYLEKHKLNKTLAQPTWTFIGPKIKPLKSSSPSSTPPGMGRMNCIAFDYNNSNTIWAGAAFGGLWKSTDAGTSWSSFSFTQFL
jgi:hypothetical protein